MNPVGTKWKCRKQGCYSFNWPGMLIKYNYLKHNFFISMLQKHAHILNFKEPNSYIHFSHSLVQLKMICLIFSSFSLHLFYFINFLPEKLKMLFWTLICVHPKILKQNIDSLSTKMIFSFPLPTFS